MIQSKNRDLLRLLSRGSQRISGTQETPLVCNHCREIQRTAFVEWSTSDQASWTVRCRRCKREDSVFGLLLKALGVNDATKSRSRRHSLKLASDVVERLLQTRIFPIPETEFKKLGISERSGRYINRSLSTALNWIDWHHDFPSPEFDVAEPAGYFEDWRWKKEMKQYLIVIAPLKLQTPNGSRESIRAWKLRRQNWRSARDNLKYVKRAKEEGKRSYTVELKAIEELKSGKRLSTPEEQIKFEVAALMRAFPWKGIKTEQRESYLRAYLALQTHTRSRTLRSDNLEGFLVTSIILGPNLESILKRFRTRSFPMSDELPRSKN